jgi:hypothetical protein
VGSWHMECKRCGWTGRQPGSRQSRTEEAVGSAAARMDLDLLYRDASAVLEDRHVLVHSVAMSDIEDSGASGLGICNPCRDAETRITAPQVVDHAHDIRRVTPKVLGMIAETMDGRS